MLIHECIECGTLSINRIAADDDPENLLIVFQDSFLCSQQMHHRCEGQGILMLAADATEFVYQQLYGQVIELSVE